MRQSPPWVAADAATQGYGAQRLRRRQRPAGRPGPDRDACRWAHELDVVESISTAVAIHKTLRSRSPHRTARSEKLYIIQSTNLAGLFIYTKGKLGPGPQGETFYVLISAKRAM